MIINQPNTLFMFPSFVSIVTKVIIYCYPVTSSNRTWYQTNAVVIATERLFLHIVIPALPLCVVTGPRHTLILLIIFINTHLFVVDYR